MGNQTVRLGSLLLVLVGHRVLVSPVVGGGVLGHGHLVLGVAVGHRPLQGPHRGAGEGGGAGEGVGCMCPM